MITSRCSAYHDDLQPLSRPPKASTLQVVRLLNPLLVAVQLSLPHERVLQQVWPVQPLRGVLLQQAYRRIYAEDSRGEETSYEGEEGAQYGGAADGM